MIDQKIIREQLFTYQDLAFKQFHEKLIAGEREIVGVRTPMLRTLAKKLAREADWENCLDWEEPLYHEERMLQAFCIGYVKADLEKIIAAAERFIPMIDNWAVNDGFCSTFKIAKKYPEEIWDFLMQYRNSKHEFSVRVVAVMLLNNYLTSEYIDRVLQVLGSLPIRGYYTSMGIAWAYATAWSAFPEKTRDSITSQNIDPDTYRRTLQKCMESYRISKEEKEWIRKERKRL